jgi:hypothetical protein
LSHSQDGLLIGNWKSLMGAETNTGKDKLRVEKLSLLVLTLCIGALVYLLVFRPF